MRSAVVTNVGLIDLLLAYGANPNAVNNLGQTPLMYTMLFAPSSAVHAIEHGCFDLNAATAKGSTLLGEVRHSLKTGNKWGYRELKGDLPAGLKWRQASMRAPPHSPSST